MYGMITYFTSTEQVKKFKEVNRRRICHNLAILFYQANQITNWAVVTDTDINSLEHS